jgi:hypothetical protein
MIRALLAGLLAGAGYGFVLAVTDDLVMVVVTTLLLIGLAIGGWVTLVAVTRSESAPGERRARRGRREVWPQRLVTLRGVLAQAVETAGAEHQRLRPLLRDIAAQRVQSGHGFAMDADPARARLLLGEPAWELLRPERPWPDDRRGPGRGLARVTEIVNAIEKVGSEDARGHAG